MKLRRAATKSALVFLLVQRLGSTPPCQKDVHLIFQTEPAGSTGELFFGAASEVAIGIPPAVPVARHTAAAAIVSNLGEAPGGGGLCRGSGCRGVWGWSVSIALEGDLKLVHATVQDANPGIVCSGAFIVTHLVDPDRPGPGGGPQGQGVISAPPTPRTPARRRPPAARREPRARVPRRAWAIVGSCRPRARGARAPRAPWPPRRCSRS